MLEQLQEQNAMLQNRIEELENVDGGSTWDPVDEECEFYNNPYGCQNPSDKGTFRKCARCKNR